MTTSQSANRSLLSKMYVISWNIAAMSNDQRDSGHEWPGASNSLLAACKRCASVLG